MIYGEHLLWDVFGMVAKWTWDHDVAHSVEEWIIHRLTQQTCKHIERLETMRGLRVVVVMMLAACCGLAFSFSLGFSARR